MLQGTIRRGQMVARCRIDGTVERVRVSELYVTEALDRVDAEEAGPGDIIAVAGFQDVTIGETLADARAATSAARHPHRRAEPGDDHRHEHVAPRRAGQPSSRRGC